MNKKAEKLHRSNIKGFPESVDTETDKLIQSIIERTSQTAVNKADEVILMQCMLNDKSYKVPIYDRNKGYVGSRCPREEALGIAVDTLSGVTGMTHAEAEALTNEYQFTKKDASRYINLGKDFIGTYMQTGRKMILTSDPRGESSINYKYVEGGKEKSVPDRQNPGQSKTIITEEYIKLVSANKR